MQRTGVPKSVSSRARTALLVSVDVVANRGELGNGTAPPVSAIPATARGLTSVVQVSAGYVHDLALGSDGTVWAWGDNQYGQLGVPTTTAMSTVSARVPGLPSIVRAGTKTTPPGATASRSSLRKTSIRDRIRHPAYPAVNLGAGQNAGRCRTLHPADHHGR